MLGLEQGSGGEGLDGNLGSESSHRQLQASWDHGSNLCSSSPVGGSVVWGNSGHTELVFIEWVLKNGYALSLG